MSTPNNSFDVVCVAGHQGLVQGEDAEVLVRVDIQLPPAMRRVSRQRTNPSALGLAFDVSSSMLGSAGAGVSKLDALVAAGSEVVALARPADQLTILHFSTAVSAPVTADGAHQAELVAAVERSRALSHQSTNMSAGLTALLQAMTSSPDGPRTALLFTDGAPDEEAGPRALADRFAEAGVPLSVIGFGDDLQLSYVEELAARGRGQVFGARDPATLHAQLRDVLGQAQQVAVSNLRAHLALAPSVIPLEVYRGKPQSQLLRKLEPNVRDYHLALGNLGAEGWQTLFVRFHVRGDRLPPVGQRQVLLRVTVTGDVPSQQGAAQSATASVELPVVANALPHNHEEVDDAFQMVRLLELYGQFEARCREQRFDEAKTIALQLRRAYQAIATPEALRADAVLEQSLAKLGSDGVLSVAELNQQLNDGVTSRTASGVHRALNPSQTRAGPAVPARPTNEFGGG